LTTAHRIVGESHLLPSRLAVNMAFAFGYDPPPVLVKALNKFGHVVATAPMNWHQWYFEYITMRKQR
jgi:hypothetical protein